MLHSFSKSNHCAFPPISPPTAQNRSLLSSLLSSKYPLMTIAKESARADSPKAPSSMLIEQVRFSTIMPHPHYGANTMGVSSIFLPLNLPRYQSLAVFLPPLGTHPHVTFESG